MQPTLYWLHPHTGGLAIALRPRGGECLQDEMNALCGAGIDVLVCTLTWAEIMELDLSGEQEAAKAAGLRFTALPIADWGVPAASATPVLRALLDLLHQGMSIAVHCRMGIGRSSLVAASLLVLDGVSPEEGWRQAEAARGVPVPDTPDQRAWLWGRS